MNLKDISKFYTAITDESIAFIIILAAIYCIISGIILPEWYTVLPEKEYTVFNVDENSSQRFSGKELINGTEGYSTVNR